MAELQLADHERVEGLDDNPPERDWLSTVTAVTCAVIALAWIGFVTWTFAERWIAFPPRMDELAVTVAVSTPPLILIGMLYGLVTRGSRGSARRYGKLITDLKRETVSLQHAVAGISSELVGERQAIGQTAAELMTLGDDAATRMRAISDAMRTEVDTVARHAHALKHSASSARADVAVLLSDLPKAHVQTREVVTALNEAGSSANLHAGALEARLVTLAVRGQEADAIAGGAAARLAAHLDRVETVSSAATERLDTAAAKMTLAIEAALDHAATAGEAARRGLDAQGAAMLALVDQAQAALQRTGSDSGEELAARIAEAGGRVASMGALLAEQSATSQRLLDQVREGLADIDAQFASLDAGGIERSARLGGAIAGVHGHVQALTGALDTGNASAEGLIGRAERLVTALDANVREIDETLPAAFVRLDQKAEASRTIIANAAPEVARIERDASAALDRLLEAEAVLVKQRAALDGYAGEADTRLAAAEKSAVALGKAVEDADRNARQLAEGAGATLVEAMVRVRDTAQQAAERARESIEAVIPRAAAQLSEASRDALAKSISDQVTHHLAELGSVAETALETAHKASDRLMRQMLTIADTTAAVEARIAETHAEIAESDRNNFARRVALLIESLNSTAIDVTKILSNEVTDTAWAAYLRGDRGVFTRRAIRLLDAGEAREVLRHYEADAEFRDQVNRYIHDFEAMLRNILATRDGTSLSVTLLSSDMGKLYVALAQAIERLRT